MKFETDVRLRLQHLKIIQTFLYTVRSNYNTVTVDSELTLVMDIGDMRILCVTVIFSVLLCYPILCVAVVLPVLLCYPIFLSYFLTKGVQGLQTNFSRSQIQ